MMSKSAVVWYWAINLVFYIYLVIYLIIDVTSKKYNNK